MSPLTTIGLAFCTSICYVTASYFMKMTSVSAISILMPVGLVVLLVGGLFEVETMRTSRMGAAFVFIICFETILVTLCAILLLGESYTAREIAGLMVIVSGIVVVSWPRADAGAGTADDDFAIEQEAPAFVIPASLEMRSISAPEPREM